jgi:uncharacterized coiled-coil DUF342 family protein
MTQTITEEPEKTWDLKDLAKALESTGGLIANAQRYRKERDEYKTLQLQWEDYAEGLEKEIKVLKEVPYVERLERKIQQLESALYQSQFKCKNCHQKAETNRRLLVALDKAKKEGGVASRTRSKTVNKDSQQIANDWAKSC